MAYGHKIILCDLLGQLMIPYMQGVICWPYWASLIFIAGPEGKQKIEDLKSW